MELKEYYQTLGIAEDADNKAVKAAHRKLASKYHPDVSEHDYAEEMFKAAGEAYEVLKDTEKRAEYDDLRNPGPEFYSVAGLETCWRSRGRAPQL
jgi:curved DNA-binding protein